MIKIQIAKGDDVRIVEIQDGFLIVQVGGVYYIDEEVKDEE